MISELKYENAFLGVESSSLSQRWVERLNGADRNTALAIAQRFDLPELIGRVLAARDVSLEDAEQFLAPSLRELMPDPDTLTDMKSATARIVQAIKEGENIAIFGDYDVDGASSAALLSRFLAAHGLQAKTHIPDRIFEGYGPNIPAIGELVTGGATLIVTVDCGATSHEALSEAERLGADVVVLDHHQMSDKLPPCVALVNPNRQDDLSGLGYLCAAGVVFMTLVSVVRDLRQSGYYGDQNAPPDLREWLDLVALATVCDVVPLKGLNRAFVLTGLKVMAMRKNLGLQALSELVRLDGPPSPYHLGFVIGPRINAGGRIGDAALGAKLLTATDPVQAAEISRTLDNLNQERQKAEAKMLEEAISEADREFSSGPGPSVIVTASDEWHPGIVGLLASRLKDRFKRPAIAVAFDRNGKGTGSGRSVAGVDLGKAVRLAVETNVIEKGGGHAMAAGLTVQRDSLGKLRGFLEEALNDAVKKVSAEQQLKIDGALTARSATIALMEQLEKAGPFGQGHSQPIFAFPAHQIRYPKIVGAGGHISFSMSAGDGAQLRAIAFRAAETPLGDLLLGAQGKQLHVAGTLNADFWQGARRMQLRVLDAADVRPV